MMILTNVQNSGFLTKLMCGGMKRGRRWLAVYLGTGKRLRMPNSAKAENSDVPIAQILKVHLKPTLSRSALRIKGNTKPRY